MDLKLTGRTLFGAMAPKGQELEDHYFGSLKRKVAAFMKDLDAELWKYGIPSKTKHNEVAPAQHEVACVYAKVNITTDNNHLLMQIAQDIAKNMVYVVYYMKNHLLELMVLVNMITGQ